MDDDSLSGLVIIIILISIRATFTLAHAAMMNARTPHIRNLADDGNRRAKRVLDLSASGELALTYQILSTLLNFTIASLAVLEVAEHIINANSSVEPVLIYTVTLLVVGFLTILLGEIVPESVGSNYANNLALWFSRPTHWLVTIFRPVVVVMLFLSKLLSTLFKSGAMVNTVTDEEIMTLVDAGHVDGTIEEEEKDMIFSVLRLDQTKVEEVMIPRIDVVAIDINTNLKEAGELFIQSGYSRIPVYEENVDTIKGLVYAKDLLACWSGEDDWEQKTIQDLMRPVFFVPETKPVDELLKELKAQKVHLAIAMDEYGGTAGLVTIENIIEEIIGDIQDEYDYDEEEDYKKQGEDTYVISANMDLDDFNELLDVDLPTDDTNTLGGYIYKHFGRVPVVGDAIDSKRLTIRVLELDGRRIRKIDVTRKRPNNGDDDGKNSHNDSMEDNVASE